MKTAAGLASAANKTKLWFSLSVKQRRNRCSRSPVYLDLSMHHDSKSHNCGFANQDERKPEMLFWLFVESAWGPNWDIVAALQMLLTEVKLYMQHMYRLHWILY